MGIDIMFNDNEGKRGYDISRQVRIVMTDLVVSPTNSCMASWLI